MRGYKMILLASAAALISTGAMADDRKVLKVSNTLDEIFLEEVTDTITVDMIENIVTKFEIDQTNRGDINAHTKVVASNVDGYTASAVAIANNASVDVKGNAAGSNWQGNWGNVSASLDANIMNATGATELTAVAIGNNFSFNVEEYGGAVVGSKQVNDGDISASLTADFSGNVNDVTTTAVAIANNFSLQTNHGSIVAGVEQVHNGNVSAWNDTTLRPMRRAVDPATAVAIGNNASISNYIPKVQ
jgi:hypothetical protein